MWCPNPADTSCLRVQGSSMSHLISNGDIVAVDRSQSGPGELSGKIVVPWHRDHGVSLSRFLPANDVQLLESENRDNQPMVMGKDRNWRLIGKVLWWIRRANPLLFGECGVTIGRYLPLESFPEDLFRTMLRAFLSDGEHSPLGRVLIATQF
jgi:hypothetical protein